MYITIEPGLHQTNIIMLSTLERKKWKNHLWELVLWYGTVYLIKSLMSLRKTELNPKSNKFSLSFFTERADRQTERADLTHTWLNQGGLLYLLKWDSDQRESSGYFGHCAHINKPVYYIYFSSFVNLLIL